MTHWVVNFKEETLTRYIFGNDYFSSHPSIFLGSSILVYLLFIQLVYKYRYKLRFILNFQKMHNILLAIFSAYIFILMFMKQLKYGQYESLHTCICTPIPEIEFFE